MTDYSSINLQLKRQAPDHRGFDIASSKLVQRLFFTFFALSLLLFVFSCASTPTSENIKNAEAFSQLGYSYFNGGHLNEAFVEFQKAVALNPKNKEALSYLGLISTQFKKYDEAISYFKRAISVDPNYADAINNLGVTYVEMGDPDEGIKQFKAALRNPLYRTPAQAYLNMGYAYYKKGDFVNAENYLRDSLIRNPVSPATLYTLGLVYLETDRDDSAIMEFKKAIGIMPDYVDAHWELAMLYLKKGDKARALKHFKAVAEKDNNVERSRTALQYIEKLKY